MKKLLVLTMVLVSANSFALTSRLEFQVRSSGPDAFPCNAGIRHRQATDTVGYRGQGTDCNGIAGCINGFETETGTRNGNILDNDNNYVSVYGIHVPDIMKGHMNLFNPAGNSWAGAVSFTKKGTAFGTAWHDVLDKAVDGNTDLVTYSTVGANDIHRVGSAPRKNNVLTDLVFLLASEQYGTEYFVDVCNYFPENCGEGSDCAINSYDMTMPTATTWSVLKGFFYGKTETALNYITLSGLKVDVVTYCDGTLRSVTEGKTNLTPGANYTELDMASLGSVPPKKCVTRFIFKESQTPKMRLNETQKGCFEVGTQIDENTDSDLSLSM